MTAGMKLSAGILARSSSASALRLSVSIKLDKSHCSNVSTVFAA